MALTTAQKTHLRELTKDLELDDIQEVYAYLKDRVTHLRHAREDKAGAQFMKGDSVSFKLKKGGREKGKIIAANAMTAKVKSFRDQREWNVSWSLLRAEEGRS